MSHLNHFQFPFVVLFSQPNFEHVLCMGLFFFQDNAMPDALVPFPEIAVRAALPPLKPQPLSEKEKVWTFQSVQQSQYILILFCFNKQ